MFVRMILVFSMKARRTTNSPKSKPVSVAMLLEISLSEQAMHDIMKSVY
jgi:hypothetical protein